MQHCVGDQVWIASCVISHLALPFCVQGRYQIACAGRSATVAPRGFAFACSTGKWPLVMLVLWNQLVSQQKSNVQQTRFIHTAW